MSATRLHHAGPWLLQRADRAPVRRKQLAPGAWLVTSGEAPTLRNPRKLGEGAWLLESEAGDRRRHVVELTEEGDEVFLVTRRRRPPHRQMHKREMALAKHLGEEHIAWVLRRLGINCVLDVGANQGQYAQRLRRAGYRGRIVSFEPLQQFVKVLEDKAADDPDWLVLPYALGRDDSTTEIHVTGTLSSLLDSSSFGKEWHEMLREEEHLDTEEITVRRLDDLFDEAVAGIDEPRVYLKLDTQGYDLEAFAGVGRRIDDVLGMQSEVSMVPIYEGMPRLPEQLAAYEAAGFETTGLFPVIRHAPTMRMIEFDLVMVRPEAAARR